MAFLLSGQPVDLHYMHQVAGERFEFDSAEIKAAAGRDAHEPSRWCASGWRSILTEGEASVGSRA